MRLRDARFVTRYWLSSHAETLPFLYLFPWTYYSRTLNERRVMPDSQLCIEGFNNSANTFFRLVMLLWNKDIRVAHHMHCPLQIQTALKCGVPTVVLIREPAATVSSIVAGEPKLSPGALLWCYKNYYDYAESVGNDVVFSEFSTVTQAPEQVIRKINARYKTRFLHYNFDAKQKARLRSIMDNRDQFKVPVDLNDQHKRDEKRAAIEKSVRAHGLFRACSDTYARIVTASC